MKNIENKILDISTTIDKNFFLSYNKDDRGFYSQNILNTLRNLVEHVCVQICLNEGGYEFTSSQYDEMVASLNDPLNDNRYNRIQGGLDFVRTRGEWAKLIQFHNFLQKSTSHYTLSERLILKYYEYLLWTKQKIHEKYKLVVLNNINLFPIKIDRQMAVYYEKVVGNINNNSKFKSEKNSDVYYIKKKSPFFIGDQIYYELTFVRASNNENKFNRLSAFTQLDIETEYAVELNIIETQIEIFDAIIPIKIIVDWKVSIRPCELEHFAEILNYEISVSRSDLEYQNLMTYLTNNQVTLLNLIDLNDKRYTAVKYWILQRTDRPKIFPILDAARTKSQQNSLGSNVIRYLMLKMNNNIIKSQKLGKLDDTWWKLGNLNLAYKTKPFDTMPFNTSLINHNPKFNDLLKCFNINGREHELLARKIKNNIENNGQIYTNLDSLKSFNNLDELVKTYNIKVQSAQQPLRSLMLDKHEIIYIQEYENTLVNIFNFFSKKLKQAPQPELQELIQSWLINNKNKIDCNNKLYIINNMFANSNLLFIYGAAGTGKTTLLNYISDIFSDDSKVYLANTNTAVQNLREKIDDEYGVFITIQKFLNSHSSENYDIIIIDECSTISNKDISEILSKTNPDARFIFVGDVYQLESIIFGNWFFFAKEILDTSIVFELTKTFRSTNKSLLQLWDKVRTIDDDLVEYMTSQNFCFPLGREIFSKNDTDQIVLCLNYDGIYGINNINKILQVQNPAPPIDWLNHIYKENDPILFNDVRNSSGVFYNNLKGVILGIKKTDDYISFYLEVNKILTYKDTLQECFELHATTKDGKSFITLKIDKASSTDTDIDNINEIVPFQVTYAISIHKAQGLEYNFVKLILTDEIDEQITHNIFYTAITRAKKSLKIFWSPEANEKIINSFQKKKKSGDFHIFKNVLSSISVRKK